VLQPTYRVLKGIPVVRLFGKLETGDPFLVEDERFRPYFFVPEEHRALVPSGSGARVVSTELRDLRGRRVVRVETPLPADVPPLRDGIEQAGGEALEADIRFAYRYLIDHGLRSSVAIRGRGERLGPRLVRFLNPQLAPASFRPALRMLSLDIETSPDASRVYSVALVGDGADEVHWVGRRELRSAERHPDECSLLSRVAQRIREIDPDVLTGWNFVDFDLRVLERRARALGLPLRLGRVDGEVLFRRDPGFTRTGRAEVPGRQVLDGLALVRDAQIRLEDYRLETAARELLGRGKLIDAPAGRRAKEIERMNAEDPEALVEYNREDARLVLDLIRKEGLLDLAVERSSLTGMQLDRVGASIASFDLVYLPELRRRGVVAPSVQTDRKSAPVTGGAVLEPQPGLYRNVAIFDFRSLYPSLMRTFHLDPLAHARPGSDPIGAPNGAQFSREEAILPRVIEEFLERRRAARDRGDRHAEFAIKILTNSLFGVLGAGACRFFDPEVANAITGFGQQTLRWTCEALEREGYRVLYGDTDSVFVEIPERASDVSRSRAEELRARIQERIESRMREQYRLEPRLELELERVYERFFLPRVRGGTGGSKKRYAGFLDGAVEVVGLEAVRRDWPRVARRLQRGVLALVFTDRPVEPFVREIVERVRGGGLDEELVFRKAIRKGALEQYTATTPPHVQAARKAGAAAGREVRYVITKRGPEPVAPGAPLPEDIDREYYVEKVLRPVAQSILEPLELRFEEIAGLPSQLNLL
jgi:DNA polymerase-2